MEEPKTDSSSIHAGRTDSSDNNLESKANVESEAQKCLLDHMEVAVTEAEKRSSNSTISIRDAYIVYLVESKVTDTKWKGAIINTCTLWRRYREFELLKNYLEITYPFVVVPPLPEKRVSFAWQKLATNEFDPDFIDRRRLGLENFLLRVAAHPVLSFDKIFMGFLQQEDDWKETVNNTGYYNKAESKLKVLSASFRLKKPDRQFEELKNYSNELQSNISNLLKVRAKLADRVYGIHKIHGNYGRVFSEWSALEKTMGDGLQSAGHYMDVFAAMIDVMLEEEEQFADLMKEYLLYTDSLKAICRKQELLQYDIEQADDNLAAKSLQRENLLKGKTSFMSRLLGTVDNDETRELKLHQLDQQIQEAEQQILLATDECNTYVEKALQEVKQFEKQKVKDIKEALILYASLQIKLCKKGITVWTSMRDRFDSI